MKPSSSSSLQFLAAAIASSETAAMSYRPPYRGGRNQCRRGFSGQSSGGRGGRRGQFVTGDSHFQSVRDANRRFRSVEGENFADQSAHPPQPRPPFNPRPDFNPSTPLYPPPPSNHRPPFNRGFRPPEEASFANQSAHPPQPRPPYNPRPYFNSSPSLNPPPVFNHNRPFRPPQQFRGPPQKPLDYRNWEFAKTGSPPQCERFTILSYNILADYLAINHWRKLYLHIPPYMLEWEWRKKNIIFELGLWSADILCFQEVDRFQDLEEALKLRGYSGTWKMRTGDPVDGCAIFWRVSRFKLLHEECIEFNKLGLRDNVAQICVLELLNQDNKKDMSSLPFSLTSSSKVVICNIHVLYNPKRGEIKLGQLRVLLDRAHAVSKLWDDVPVVLCGDFNFTPRSPLYNYISDQKLNLSDLPRDKLSGQASGEIRPPRGFSPSLRALSAADITGGASAVVDHNELRQSCSLFDVKEQNIPEINSVNLNSINSLSHHQCFKTELTLDDNNSLSGLCGNKNDASSYEMTNKTHQEVDSCKDEMRSEVSVQYGGLKESPNSSENKGGSFVELIKDGHESTMVDSHHENIYSNVIEMGLAKETREDTVLSCKDELHSTISASGLKASSSNPQNEGKISGAQRKDGYECTPVSGHEDIYLDLIEAENGENLYAAIDAQCNSSSEQSQPDRQIEKESLSCDDRKLSFMGSSDSTDAIIDPVPSGASTSNISSSHLFHETSVPCIPNVSTMGSSENLSSQSFADDKHAPSTMSKVNVSYELKSIDYKVDETMENLSLKVHFETNEEDESFGEDSTKFLSELHDENNSLSSDLSHTLRSNFVQSDISFEKSTTIAHSRNEILDGDYPRMDSEPIDAFKFAYDPSAWTPMEIETATGNTDRTLVEHHLKLRSTYAEVEDYSGTRDSNGEPLATSYNRCFIGTVDYIWRSEGLQTVRVLAPIPKHVMQQTPGFPTKKWGSDHIALVSELAFVKDAGSVQNKETS